MAGNQDQGVAQNPAATDKPALELLPGKLEINEKESNGLPASSTPNGALSPTLNNLKLSADSARQAHDNETAIKAYTQALKLVGENPGFIDPQTEYDLLSGREIGYGLIGLYREEQADLEVMES
jgi:hypothetical protein